MKITFIGAAHEVTGSCHYVEVGDKKFLVDCGMEQGADLYENQEIPSNVSDIDYVFITHAHIDHSGLLPLLYNHGFRGQVFCTEATKELCNIMLKDSAHIQEQEAEWKNRKAKRAGLPEVTPMYSFQDAVDVLALFTGCNYHDKIQVCPEIAIRFVDAGHLLGSSSIEIWLKENDKQIKMVFSGDIGNENRPIVKNPEYIHDADYVLMESTYGDRFHDKPKDFAVPLAEVIERTIRRGGNVVIPAFSVGRTQEMLFFIRRIKEEKLVSDDVIDFPVYMDSPLSLEATTIFGKNFAECYNEEALAMVTSGKNPIGFPGLHVAVTSDESRNINFDPTPKVIISASGMCEAGRIRHHLKHNLWRKECSVIFVGYQVPGTLGNALLGGVQEVRLFGETVNVNADICQLPGISGHADQGMLLHWISQFTTPVKKVFVIHGEDEVTEKFAQLVEQQCGFESYAPFTGDSFDLLTGEKIAEGNHIKIKKPEKKEQIHVSGPYARLLAAGQRLLTVIRHNQGGANKDLGKFADQINSLCDKWDR